MKLPRYCTGGPIGGEHDAQDDSSHKILRRTPPRILGGSAVDEHNSMRRLRCLYGWVSRTSEVESRGEVTGSGATTIAVATKRKELAIEMRRVPAEIGTTGGEDKSN
jgi:hypothetical protein